MEKYRKAIIEIEKIQIDEVQEKEDKPSIASSGGISPMGNVTDKLKSAVNESAKNGTGMDLGNAVSAISGNTNSDTEEFSVQFNPENISISVAGKPGKGKTGADVKHKIIDYGRNAVKVNVTIPLIFDGKETEKNVNKFLDAVRNPYSRNISFSWGNQFYKGQLYSVSSEYTMFSEQGKPLRAKVNIKLLCCI